MNNNYKILISWILVLIWMITIFYLSSMDSDQSNTKSKETINVVVENTIDVTNNIGITNEPTTKDNINSIVNVLNKPLRKCMHATVYFVLVILVINAFNQMHLLTRVNTYLYSIIICFIYACTDEIHQLYVVGRTGQFIDVLIDTIGALLGCLVFYIGSKIIKKNRKSKINS